LCRRRTRAVSRRSLKGAKRRQGKSRRHLVRILRNLKPRASRIIDSAINKTAFNVSAGGVAVGNVKADIRRKA
jgi:hypothetical protein